MPRKKSPLTIARESNTYLQNQVTDLRRSLQIAEEGRMQDKKAYEAKLNSVAPVYAVLEHIGMLANANTQLVCTAAGLVNKVVR